MMRLVWFVSAISLLQAPVSPHTLMQVYRLLDEMIIAGEVLETSKKEINAYLRYLEQVEGSEKTGLFSK